MLDLVVMMYILISRNPKTKWWYESDKLRIEFVHNVWALTSGSVNTFEAVERHALEWLKREEAKYKKRLKVNEWKEAKQREADLWVETRQEALKKATEKADVHDCKDC